MDSKNTAFLYTVRPLERKGKCTELKYLSLCEFLRYWRIELVTYPLTPTDILHMDNEEFHATPTVEGCAKLHTRTYEDTSPLLAGIDYVVKNQGGKDWFAFPDIPSLQRIRHTWMITRNERPKNPTFHQAPMPKRKEQHEERNALITMSYFHPFTLQEDFQDEHVPHITNLRGGHELWQTALIKWLGGNVLCSESQRYIQNYFNVAQMRPEYIDAERKNDEDIFSDEELDRTRLDLDEALRTHPGHSKENEDIEGPPLWPLTSWS